MMFNCNSAGCNFFQSLHHKIYLRSMVSVFIASGIVLLNLLDIHGNKAVASDRSEVLVTPKNFLSYLIGFGDYTFKVPSIDNIDYVYYGNNEIESYPLINSLTLNHANVSYYINRDDSNFVAGSKLKVNEFIIEDGALTIEARPNLSFEVDRFFQYGGNTQIFSFIAGQVGLRSNQVDVDMLTGKLNVVAQAGIGVKGDLTLKNGTVVIEANAIKNIDNDLPVAWQGGVNQLAGSLNVFSTGGTGIKGDKYILNDGKLKITAFSAGDVLDAVGIQLSRQFLQTAGTNIVVAEGGKATGILLHGNASYMLDGNDSQLNINVEKNAVGLKRSLSVGETVDDYGYAFTLNGGELSIDATSGGKGFYFEDGGININNGNVSIEARDGGIGIEVVNEISSSANFTLNDGNITISAINQNSIGLKSEHVMINGGALEVFTQDNGTAIDIGSGRFDMHAGNLRIHQSAEAGGRAIYGSDNSSAFFGKDAKVETIIDIDAAIQMTGLMSFGSVTIEEGARLKLGFINTAAFLLQKDSLGEDKKISAINASFLESRNAPILGEFVISPEDMNGETLFYDYRLVRSDNQKDYRLIVIPKGGDSRTTGDGGNIENGDNNGNEDINNNVDIGNDQNDLLLPSHLLFGANKNAAFALETVLDNGSDNTNLDNLNQAFDKLYNSRTEEELERHARGLTAHQTTKLTSLTMAMFDRIELDLLAELDKTSQEAVITTVPVVLEADSPQIISKLRDKLIKNNSKNVLSNYWMRPVTLVNRYEADDTSYTALKANYSGLMMGFSNKLDTISVGASASYVYGKLSGDDGYSAKSNGLLLTAGLQTDEIALTKKFKPSFNLVGSYGYNQYDQNRRDVLGALSKSDVNVNSVRLATQMLLNYDISTNVHLQPKLGVDYSFIHLGSYQEQGGTILLAVDGKNYNALRTNIGSDINIAINDRFALNAYGVYRYQMMDNNNDLHTKFMDASYISFISEGEKSDRFSGSLGASGQIKLNDIMSISGGYDRSILSKLTSHQFYLKGNVKF